MKQNVLRRLLPGLIFILLISVLYGCADKTPVLPGSTEPQVQFSPEYYIYKKTKQADWGTLEKYTRDDNMSVAHEAGLVLGYYYMREGRFDEAYPYITNYYSSSYLSDYMKRMGELWNMELSLAYEDNAQALAMADQLLFRIEDNATIDALVTYCTISRLTPTLDGPYSCVEERLAQFIDKNAPVDNVSLSGNLNILVTSTGSASASVSSAISYYMNTHNMKHKVRFAKEYIEADWDFIVDVTNSYLAGRGYGIYFTPDIASTLVEMEYYAGLKTCGRVLLGVGRGLDGAASTLEQNLVDAGMEVRTVDITDGRSAVVGIREHLSKWDQLRYCAVGAGTEEEINYFVPNVRQYVLDSSKQNIFIVESVDTGKHYSKDYVPYYGGAILFPTVDLTLGQHVKEVAEAYKQYTGRAMTYEAMLAYDMIQYIYYQTDAGKEAAEPYLTNISGVSDGKVTRPVRAFFIHTTGEVEELVLVPDDEVQ